MSNIKTRITERQYDNLLEAKKMWDSVPEKNVMPALADWRSDRMKSKAPDCNTLACFGGWCAWWPAFQGQGVSVTSSGAPMIACSRDLIEQGAQLSKRLFGNENMFNVRNDHRQDQITSQFMHNPPRASDWQIVMNRIDLALKNSVTKD